MFRFRMTLLLEGKNDSNHGRSTPLKDKSKVSEASKRARIRYQIKKFQAKLNELQLALKNCLMVDEELKPKGELLSKF